MRQIKSSCSFIRLDVWGKKLQVTHFQELIPFSRPLWFHWQRPLQVDWMWLNGNASGPCSPVYNLQAVSEGWFVKWHVRWPSSSVTLMALRLGSSRCWLLFWHSNKCPDVFFFFFFYRYINTTYADYDFQVQTLLESLKSINCVCGSGFLKKYMTFKGLFLK